jgi:hypothetical protein
MCSTQSDSNSRKLRLPVSLLCHHSMRLQSASRRATNSNKVTPRKKGLLDKPNSRWVKQEIACFYGTCSFTIVFKRFRHWSQLCSKITQPTSLHTISQWTILILSRHLLLHSSSHFPIRYRTKVLLAFSIFPMRAIFPVQLIHLDMFVTIFAAISSFAFISIFLLHSKS